MEMSKAYTGLLLEWFLVINATWRYMRKIHIIHNKNPYTLQSFIPPVKRAYLDHSKTLSLKPSYVCYNYSVFLYSLGVFPLVFLKILVK